MTYNWSEARVATTLRLADEGYSASEIAKQIGDTTRNAVIGKLHRMKKGSGKSRLRGAQKPPKKPAKPWKRTRRDYGFSSPPPEVRRAASLPPEPPTPPDMPPARGLGIDAMRELQQHDCKWPIGDVGSLSFRFCGSPRELGKPYCSHHCEHRARKGRDYGEEW